MHMARVKRRPTQKVQVATATAIAGRPRQKHAIKKKTATQRQLASDVCVAAFTTVCRQAAILQKKIPHPLAHLNRNQRARRQVFGPGTVLKKTTRAASFARALGNLPLDVYERLVATIVKSKGGDSSNTDPKELLDQEERVYAFESGPCEYGTLQGIVRKKPMGGTGWVKFKVKDIDPADPRFNWSVGYHGTDPAPLLPIIDNGLSSPADRNCDPAHGQVGSSGDTVGRTIYTSPCIGYAAHPVYGPLIKTGSGKYAQIILEARVDQTRVYNKLKTSLGKLYWDDDVPFDAQFTTSDDMEWLVSDRDALFVTGVLFRELGSDTEECNSRYGTVAGSFQHHGPGPEFAWTAVLADSIKNACV